MVSCANVSSQIGLHLQCNNMNDEADQQLH